MSGLVAWAKKIGGEVYDGYVLAPGPGHSPRDRSMKIWLGPDDLLRVHSFSGDPWQTCKDYLRDLGLPVGDLPDPEEDQQVRPKPARPKPRPIEPHPRAVEIWREARPDHPLLRAYLEHRRISLDPPPSLRLHPGLGYFDKSGPGAPDYRFPALVAGVQAPDRRLVAVQRTYLAHDGEGKAAVSMPKKSLGSMGAGAIRLAPAAPCLGLVEGIEDGLSVMELIGLGCWVAMGGGRFSSIALPPEVREVHIFAQNDPSGTSQKDAEKAAARLTRQGRRVLIRLPANDLKDWNDALQAERRGYA